MPLHLLPKKSWNVYSPANIARVKRDETRAAEAEVEAERKADETDAVRRLRVLRGEGDKYTGDSVIPKRKHKGCDKEAAAAAAATVSPKWKDTEREAERELKKRMRRRPGEDDTDRDIRIARDNERERVAKKIRMIDNVTRTEDGEDTRGYGRNDRGTSTTDISRDTDLLDARGHIVLFPEPLHQGRGSGRNGNDKIDTQDSRKRKSYNVTISPYSSKDKQKQNSNKNDIDDGNGTRLIDALTNRRGTVVAPWYNNDITNNTLGSNGVTLEGNKQRRAEGNHHQNLQKKAVAVAKVAASNDPLTMMRRAQMQIKKVERSQEEEEEGIGRGDPYGTDYYYKMMRKDRKRAEKKELMAREREAGGLKTQEYEYKHRNNRIHFEKSHNHTFSEDTPGRQRKSAH